MHKCREAQQADLILDGHAWQFATLRDAVTTYRKLRTYRGAQWPDFPATIRRLHADASAAERAWYHREQHRVREDLTSPTVLETAAPTATLKPLPQADCQGQRLEETS
jgi:hypothetical protein